MATVVKWTLDLSGIALLKNKLESYWVDWIDLGQQASGWSLAARMNEPGTWLKYRHIGDGLYQTYLTLPTGTELVITNLVPLLGPGEIHAVEEDIPNPLTQLPPGYEAKTLGAETQVTEPPPRSSNLMTRIKQWFKGSNRP